MDASIRELQLIEYEILKHFKNLCEKHGLQYYLSGGTLLGAVRHGGFIPWDDDIDVAMPRPDYEKFLKLAKDDFKEPYALLTNELDEKYIYAFAKIIDRRYYVITKAQNKPQKWNVWIDVFPLDSMPRKGMRFQLRKYHILYRRLMMVFASFDDMVVLRREKRPLIEKILLRIGLLIHPNRFMNYKKQIKKYNKVLLSYPFEKGKYNINLMGVYKFRSLMEKDVYGKKTELKFENDTYSVPEKYDEYLKRIYGNYMKLPPENKRNHHEIELKSSD